MNTKAVFFIDCGIDYTICMEDSLKIKEISYISSEVYTVYELKQGIISIEDNILAIGVVK